MFIFPMMLEQADKPFSDGPDIVLDGELVVLDPTAGVPDFELTMARFPSQSDLNCRYPTLYSISFAMKNLTYGDFL
ncbi:hypothetical protein [Brevibacillus sp. FIR094]|uniref:hypothetical protein n=1 Tax=Brevibacillus sp. FIR094 TaxID=3134809 RepID=UPI003D227B3B